MGGESGNGGRREGGGWGEWRAGVEREMGWSWRGAGRLGWDCLGEGSLWGERGDSMGGGHCMRNWWGEGGGRVVEEREGSERWGCGGGVGGR